MPCCRPPALQRHSEAFAASDFEAPPEHEIYRDDAVLHYPQSGERIRGRHNIQRADPSSQAGSVYGPANFGGGKIWITEFVLT